MADCIFPEMTTSICLSHPTWSFYNVSDTSPPRDKRSIFPPLESWSGCPNQGVWWKESIWLSGLCYYRKDLASTCLFLSGSLPWDPPLIFWGSPVYVDKAYVCSDPQPQQDLQPTVSINSQTYVEEPLNDPSCQASPVFQPKPPTSRNKKKRHPSCTCLDSLRRTHTDQKWGRCQGIYISILHIL